jgi:hypothetical protein
MKKIADFLFRPRYLRAIPSLVVLTTAMAWGVAPDPDTDMADPVQKRASVSLSQAAVGATLLSLPAPGKADS